ncbi:DegT/DnrJ/EryC1/StrS family aminotransferase [Cognatishimia sp. D5M38]|uniref:DegT/DnrJ/EryC1/StrS family aminotransferase n=1 Tax=Cognatishimia coralii TaxID=3083254 RepID=A0ABU8QKV5_9RHOB
MTEQMVVPIARTSLEPHEVQSVLGPLESGWLVQGPNVKSFEDKWSAFTGAPYSLAVTSCTTGMHLAVAALGLSPGDEVIVPAFTWIATANVIEHQGAKPVFCDIDPLTFNIDMAHAATLVTERTVGIMPVHLFGLSADMTAVMALAEKHGLWVVEDAACGFGATFDGQHVGHFGNAGAFSFHPRKAITTGEGGMVTTADEALSTKIQQLRDHGAVMSDLQRHLGPKPYLLADHIHAGYNQRMTDIQGALGSAQMDRASAIIEERRAIAAEFDEAFSNLDSLRTPHTDERYGHGYQSYPCMVTLEGSVESINAARNAWMETLQTKGVSTRPATHAVHMLSFYSEKYNLKSEDFPNARAANDCSISLPLFHGMTEAEKTHVIKTVLETAPT